MAVQKWSQKTEESLSFLSLKQPLLYHLTINILSLLLPLSFLLLARLDSANFLLALSPRPPLQNLSSFFISLFLFANPFLLYTIVFFVSFATLCHSLTGKFAALPCSSRSLRRPPLYTLWIFISSVQVFIGLAIEGSIATGVEASSYGGKKAFVTRAFFFFGLHQTMLHWEKMVVKRVVDDAVFGADSEEKWFEKAAMAVTFSSLWWWRLRHEVEALAAKGGAKRSATMEMTVVDLPGWCLYHLTVIVGIVKVVKVLSWPLSKVLACTRKTKKKPFDEVEDEILV